MTYAIQVSRAGCQHTNNRSVGSDAKFRSRG